MRRVLSFVALLFVMLGFAVTSQGILRVTMLELRLQIMRDQLLNYELSSRMLKARFKQMARKQSDDIGTEMKMKVLESGVLNSRQEASTMKLDPMERMGLFTVNLIRRISLKSTLSLEEDQGKLILLEYAFFQERQRNFEQASKAYAELEARLKTESGDNQAFALLHYGYCLALLGDIDEAKRRLVTVKDDYKGTHYAENASLLLAMLSAGEETDKDIQTKYKDDRDKARAYYEAGQYAMAVKTFDTLNQLNNRETFMHGRSLEETGQKDRAVA
ncbi:MAG: hypothetical protein HY042_00770, partial [Spirochaetia bacterium]|nr:hypothetical protein [Spirochaetia bacterium]